MSECVSGLVVVEGVDFRSAFKTEIGTETRLEIFFYKHKINLRFSGQFRAKKIFRLSLSQLKLKTDLVIC